MKQFGKAVNTVNAVTRDWIYSGIWLVENSNTSDSKTKPM